MEPIIGYSHTVRIGAYVQVLKQLLLIKNAIKSHGNPYLQTIKSIKNIETALRRARRRAAGCCLHQNICHKYCLLGRSWKAHTGLFQKILSATNMVQVRRLITPEVLVEIQTDDDISCNL
jgi:hypothetical protein